MFGGGFGAAAPAAGTNPNGDQDLTAQGGPSSSISAVCTGMVPAGLIQGTTTPTCVVGCSSWDGKAYVWAVSPSGTNPPFQAIAKPEWFISHADPANPANLFPILDCCFSPTDPNNPGNVTDCNFYTGSCDGTAKVRSLTAGQEAVLGKHAKPIRIVRAYRSDQNNAGSEVLATASWDGTVSFWEMAKMNPQAGPQSSFTINLNAQGQKTVWAMDVKYPVCVIGTGPDNFVHIYNLANPAQPAYPSKTCQLSHQMRTLSVFPDQLGYAVGSIEGRVGITYFNDQTAAAKSFAFRCHRDQVKNNSENLVFPVNSICFHGPCKTFATAGADGAYNFWDKDSKQCIKKGKKIVLAPNIGIVSGAFSPDGMIYCYATSYEWLKGKEYFDPSAKNQIWLRHVQPDDVKPRTAAQGVAGRRR